jgi:hypothetical protein
MPSPISRITFFARPLSIACLRPDERSPSFATAAPVTPASASVSNAAASRRRRRVFFPTVLPPLSLNEVRAR